MIEEIGGEIGKAKHGTELIDEKEKWWLQFVPDSKKWSDVNIARFLSFYKAHPILWDPRNSFYDDQRRRMKAYGMIARRLNLFGVGEKECIELVKSLRSIYALKKKRREAVAGKCNRQKYTPCWYQILEELIECVKKRLTGSPEDRAGRYLLILGEGKEAELTKPWEKCCPKLYTEDIWTPDHFRTNITNWFLDPEEEEQELLCTCPEAEVSRTTSEDICYTEMLSGNESSDETVPCTARKSSSSSYSSARAECCYDKRNSQLPKKYGGDLNDEEIEKCCEKKLREIEVTDGGLCCCNTSESDNQKAIEETIQCPLENTETHSADKIDGSERSSSDKFSFRPCGTEAFLKSSSTGFYAGSGSGNLSSGSRASDQRLSTDCCHSRCRSDSNSNSLTPKSSSSRSKSRSLSQEVEGSARTRLDIEPDLTQCEKCAVERVKIIIDPKSERYVFEENPRIPDLDKYCRYKDWDKIYNIRTEITSDQRMLPISKKAEKKSIPMPKEEDERSRPSSQNYSLTETDGLIFTDLNSSDVRRVSLIDEYNREYGFNIPINQRKHFTCEDSENLVFRPVQLIL